MPHDCSTMQHESDEVREARVRIDPRGLLLLREKQRGSKRVVAEEGRLGSIVSVVFAALVGGYGGRRHD